jgi:allantoinase
VSDDRPDGAAGNASPGTHLVVRARRAVVAGREQGATLAVDGGRVVAVGPFGAPVPRGATVLELADDEVLLPGLVDTHVHVNEPGRTHWEGFASATRAAAAGGVTTIVDMPLNSIPPTTEVAALRAKQEAAQGRCWVDVGFWGGIVPGNLGRLRPLHEAGVLGFKCFLLDSGVEEFPPVDPEQLGTALAEAADLDALVLVHAEDAATVAAAPAAHGRSYAGFLASRPPAAEERAVARVVAAAGETGARVHVVHLSDAGCLPLVRAARAEGVRVSAETCPHYLTLEAEQVPDGATEFACCPPIRGHANREGLWGGLADGTIGTVVTDHSPSPIDLKALDTGDFGHAWGGIAGLQVGLAAVWTEARRRGHTLADVVAWMATGPADQVGLTDRGRIEPGATADLVVFAPDERFTVDVTRLQHRNPVSAYAGRTLDGVVRSTLLRGIPVDPSSPPRGRLLRRGAS